MSVTQGINATELAREIKQAVLTLATLSVVVRLDLKGKRYLSHDTRRMRS
ncbi:MAG: hypothetical protein LH628_10890 [Microcoleus sp. CAN_BIN18]|nr:hypothetical protein [Microcoleus sp. CAN_BIN18]